MRQALQDHRAASFRAVQWLDPPAKILTRHGYAILSRPKPHARPILSNNAAPVETGTPIATHLIEQETR